MARRWRMALLGVTAVTVGCGGSAVVEAETGQADDEAVLAEAAFHDSVFPLPDGAVSPLLPYDTFNDGIVSSESSSFLVEGPTIGEALDFYRETLADYGYSATDTTTDDGKTTLHFADLAHPGVEAMVSVAPGLSGDSILITQRRTVTDARQLASSADPDDDLTGSEGAGGDVAAGTDDGSSAGSTEPGSGDGSGATGQDGADGEPAADADTSESLPALDTSGDGVLLRWDELGSVPGVVEVTTEDTGRLYRIENDPAVDGFHLVIDFNLDWGDGWHGQVGEFIMHCEGDPGSTGICPFFDPDGDGPAPRLGDDYSSSGLVTIERLDPGGYRILVDDLIFSDGTYFQSFTMTSASG